MIPPSMGPYLAPITALVSMPLTFFMSNDAFFYGVLPILAEAASHYGISPEAIARASIVGQPVHLLSPLVPSTYLLCGLAKVDFADHQKFTFKWAFITCMVLMGTALVIGVFRSLVHFNYSKIKAPNGAFIFIYLYTQSWRLRTHESAS